jgi:hypothetical protein
MRLRIGLASLPHQRRLQINSGPVSAAVMEALKKIFLKFKLIGRLIAFDAWVETLIAMSGMCFLSVLIHLLSSTMAKFLPEGIGPLKFMTCLARMCRRQF